MAVAISTTTFQRNRWRIGANMKGAIYLHVPLSDTQANGNKNI